MFKRTLDATFLNSVVNDPEVRPWLGGEGEIDLSEIVSNPENFTFVTEGGGWIAIRHEPGVYELHTQFLKAGRGRSCIEVGRAVIQHFFAATDAREIITKVPAANRAAAVGAAMVGFKERFTRPGAWTTQDGTLCDVSYQALELDRWAGSCPEAKEAGEWFHRQFDGFGLPPHPEDEVHDYYVGAATLMMRAGNPHKAVWFYNRWARFVGYPLATLVSEHPVVIDMSADGFRILVEISGERMEVIQCR